MDEEIRGKESVLKNQVNDMDINKVIANENRMWEAAISGDADGFLKFVDENAVMVCGGLRCSGKEYAGFLSEMTMCDYEITRFEIICCDENSYQIHYIVKTEVSHKAQTDCEGKFHVTSTWKKYDDKYKLVFNMDSRIIE